MPVASVIALAVAGAIAGIAIDAVIVDTVGDLSYAWDTAGFIVDRVGIETGKVIAVGFAGSKLWLDYLGASLSVSSSTKEQTEAEERVARIRSALIRSIVPSTAEDEEPHGRALVGTRASPAVRNPGCSYLVLTSPGLPALAAAESCPAGLFIIDDGLWAPELEELPAVSTLSDANALVDSLAALSDLALGVVPDAPLEVKIATLVALAGGRDQPDPSDLKFGRAMCSRELERF